MHQLSPAGIAVLSTMSPSSQRPRVLRDAVRAAQVPADDLPELIAFAWLRDDSPTADISEADWLEIFAASGFFSYPTGRHRPTSPVNLYRGARADRRLGMPSLGGRSRPRDHARSASCLARSSGTLQGRDHTVGGPGVPLARWRRLDSRYRPSRSRRDHARREDPGPKAEGVINRPVEPHDGSQVSYRMVASATTSQLSCQGPSARRRRSAC